jgi:hypothetical protein
MGKENTNDRENGKKESGAGVSKALLSYKIKCFFIGLGK